MATGIVERSLEALRAAEGEEEHDCLEACRDALLQNPEAGQELVATIGATERGSQPDETALALLAAVLETARMIAENGNPDGRRFLDAVEARLGAMAGSRALTVPGRVALAGVFVRAGLSAPPHLIVGADEMDLDPGSAPDLQTVLDEMRQEAGSNPLTIYIGISEMMASMPGEVKAMIVGMLAARDEEVFSRASGYWLLDRDADLRRAVAEAMRARAEAGALDPAAATRLTLVRPWLPADAARDALDLAIRAALRREAAGGARPKPWKLHRMVASIPDGSGAQSIAVAAQSGGRRVVAMLLLKQGFGVKDAYLIPCESASEQRRLLARVADEAAAEDVPPDFLRPVLADALGEGLEAGCLPAPGLIDLAEVCGIDTLHPEARSVAGLIADLDPEGDIAGMSPPAFGRMVMASRDWVDTYDVLDSWFEDTAAAHEVQAQPGSHAARMRAMRAMLEQRRGWWARLIARAAVVLRAAGDPAWPQFAATAHALDTGRDLRKIPIMEDIAEWTLERPGAPLEPQDTDGLPVTPPPAALEKPGELARILKRAKLTPEWLDGYLMSLAVAPKMVRPGDWIASLVETLPEFPDRAAVQRFLDIVTSRYNAANQDAADPARLRQRFDALSPEALADWADGFTSAADWFRAAWSGSRVGKDDKAMLRRIDQLAAGAADDSLRATLAMWLGARFRARG
jgi:yecA family protein